MQRNVLVVLSMIPLSLTSPASAVNVTNLDDEPRTVSVDEGESKQDHILKSGAVLDGICLKGCLIRIIPNGGDPYVLEGSEVTSIENGQLWSDDKDVPTIEPDIDPETPSSSGPRP